MRYHPGSTQTQIMLQAIVFATFVRYGQSSLSGQFNDQSSYSLAALLAS